MRNLAIFLTLFLSLLFPSIGSAAQTKLAWDPNAESDLAGYKVYYGTASGTYGTPINVGNVTTYTLTGLTNAQTYFIAVTAYDTSGQESGYSDEVSGTANDSETVSTPNVLSGPTGGTTGTSYAFTTGGSTSNLGHSVQYQFDWKGDGTDLSAWGSATQSKTWTISGTFNVRARGRCSTHTSLVSSWSGSLSVTIRVAAVSCTVTPSDGLTSSGNQGGPFSPPSKSYTLQNTGGSLINWTISKGQAWTTLSSTSGTLAAGASTTVTVSINSNANTLPVGSYSDIVSFTNTTNGNGNTTIPVTLTITGAKPVVSVTALDSTATEAGPTTGTYRISRTSVNTSSALTVYFSMSGTAGNGTDYKTISSPRVIPTGALYVDVVLTPINDTLPESNETAILTLTANAAYNLGSPSSATITIVSDD